MSQEKKLIERTSKLVDQYNKIKDLKWELHQNSSQLVEAEFKHKQAEKKFDQIIENFMLAHLEDCTNDQVIKKVIKYLGAENEEKAKKILSKFNQQVEL